MDHPSNMLRPARAEETLPVEDRLDILELITLYALSFDDQNTDEFLNLFTDDCIVSYRWDMGRQEHPFDFLPEAQHNEVRGRDDLAKFAAADFGFAKTGHTISRRHCQPNSVLRRVDDDVAAGTSMALIGYLLNSDGGEPWYDEGFHMPTYITGFYVDEFRRTDRGWRFSKRQGIFDQKIPHFN